jgi:hypothetical protein
VSREDDEEKLWNWLRKTYPPEDKTFDWIAVISPFRVEERKELRLVNQKPVRIIRSVMDEAIVEAESGVRVRIPLAWVRARCSCPWSMGLRGCECGAVRRDADVSALLGLILPED